MNAFEISSSVSGYQLKALSKQIGNSVTIIRSAVVKLWVTTSIKPDFEYTGLAGALTLLRNRPQAK
jgi:hypothetical protein